MINGRGVGLRAVVGLMSGVFLLVAATNAVLVWARRKWSPSRHVRGDRPDPATGVQPAAPVDTSPTCARTTAGASVAVATGICRRDDPPGLADPGAGHREADTIVVTLSPCWPRHRDSRPCRARVRCSSCSCNGPPRTRLPGRPRPTRSAPSTTPGSTRCPTAALRLTADVTPWMRIATIPCSSTDLLATLPRPSGVSWLRPLGLRPRDDLLPQRPGLQRLGRHGRCERALHLDQRLHGYPRRSTSWATTSAFGMRTP